MLIKKCENSGDILEEKEEPLNNDNLNIKEENISVDDKKKQNIINLFGSEFVDIQNDFIEKPDTTFFEDVCSICSSPIYYKKFICVICPNCVLCEKCQDEHSHPIIKSNKSQFSNINDIYNYLKYNNPDIKNEVKGNSKKFDFFSNLFSNKYELILSCNSLNFSMRQNQKLKIPITIQNLSKTAFDCGKYKLFLFGRNNKDLKVYETNVNNILNSQEQIDVNMIIESNDVKKKYYFSVELYTLEDVILKSNSLSFSVEVNEDKEDDLLNEEFKDYPKIIVMDKNIKKGVKKILEDKTIVQDPTLIMQFLVNNKGNIEETIKNLKSMDSNKIIL